MRPPWINDHDGQETCPDRESNPGLLRERRIRYPLLHNVYGFVNAIGIIFKNTTSEYN
ncbi:hypothetical protein C0J52_24449 [Blattella germanica]|nr:hypothetical protein C0J52_24449 [Blattella germanica]